MNGNNQNEGHKMPKGGRLAFGIFMILVYVTIGCLFIFQVIPLFNSPVAGYICGGLLCLYGGFRGYRLYNGLP